MSTTAPADPPADPARRRVPAKAVLWGLLALVVAAMALDTSYRSTDAPPVTAGGREAFDPVAFGRETFGTKVAPAIEKDATEITELVPALQEDQAAASEQYGRREGSSPYNFPVRGEGVAGEAKGGLLPVEVKGLKETTVSVQIGPAINGTALRDVTGQISFTQFVNQVDYADAATALNTEVKTKVLASIDREALKGKTVSFLGAFTLVAPTVVTITPVKLEVTG